MGAMESSSQPDWYSSLKSGGELKQLQEERQEKLEAAVKAREEKEKTEEAQDEKQAYYDCIEKLVKKQDHYKLRKIVPKFIENYGEEDDFLQVALQYLRIVDKREELEQAMMEGKYEKLKGTIECIEREGYEKMMHGLVIDAKIYLDQLERIKGLGQRVLKFESKTLHELKHYNNPPEVVHHVLMAALLLQGEHELKTKTWRRLQRFITPYGLRSFVKKARAYNIAALHPDIAARARQILQPYDRPMAVKSSAGIGKVYEWTQGIVDEYSRGGSPASPEQQLEIFGCSEKVEDFESDGGEDEHWSIGPPWLDAWN